MSGGASVDPQLDQRVDDSGARVLTDLDQVGEQIDTHCHVQLADPCCVG